MTIISTTKTKKLKGPQNASELINQINLDPNEGVQVAVWPGIPDIYELGPSWTNDRGVTASVVYAECGGNWGRRVVDILLDPVGPVKWWKVREHARVNKLDLVPVSWIGAAQDIPDKYFTELGLGIRLFGEGPWFWPMSDAPDYTEANLKILEVFGSA